MPIMQNLKVFVIPFVLISLQPGIVLANDSGAVKQNEPTPVNRPKSNSDNQSSASLLNKFVNNTGSFNGMSTETYDNAGIISNNYAKRYMIILTGKLSKQQIDIEKLNTYEESVFEYDGYVPYKGTFQELNQIKQVMLVTSLWKSGEELYKKTRLSKKIKRIEKKIAKYCIIEYSKASSGEQAEFYMPGELDDEEMKKEKEYQMSVSSFFSPDEESLDMDFKVTLNTLFYKTNLVSHYSFLKEETAIRFSSIPVNTITGMDIGVSVIKKKQTNPVFLFKSGISF